MADLKTSYSGLSLSNPVLAGSSGMTGSLSGLKRLRDNGVGGVVLKSLFEEQIRFEIQKEAGRGGVIYGYDDIDDYVAYYERKHQLYEYMQLIREAKAELDIPVIASVNCFSSGEWKEIAAQVQEAGADALQLNIFVPSFETDLQSADVEGEYVEIVRMVSSLLEIPVTAKIGYYFTSIPTMVARLLEAGAAGVVLFNRYYASDFDLDSMKLISGPVFSGPEEMTLPLQWISRLAGKVNGSLTGATGVHDGDGLIKLLLAGADAVEVVSALYSTGPDAVSNMIGRLSQWMEEKGYSNIADFRGALSRSSSGTPEFYDRMQYMKYYGELKAAK
ncbi:MAG: dihydroorotate dehydrogenase-like protein [Spirochaetales bacterium]|nr:dihydroorotate dehydrogenase-like protein [Spirochaetales bacterium]MCF7939442.1 dihydroorotate dehydrogenase-like protein [Spirochaetales bacterium]